VGDFAGAQAGTIRCGKRRLLLERGGRLEQAFHFVGTEYYWQSAWLVDGAHLAQRLVVFQRDLKEESQPGNVDVDRLAGR
jgi:hypothetical protein